MVFRLIWVFLFLLPFLDGGTNFLSEVLILILPLPLFLLGFARNELFFENLPKKIIGFWLLFLFFVGISVIFSTSKLFSIPAYFQLLAFFVWFVLFLLAALPRNNEQVAKLVMLTGLALSLVSFYYLLPGAKRPPMGMNLIYASYNHNNLADILLLSIPLAFAYLVSSKSGKNAILYRLLILLYIFSFILTFSRGAFLILPVAILGIYRLVKPNLRFQKIINWLLVILPLVLLLLIFILSKNEVISQIRHRFPQNWLVKQLVKPEFQAKRLDYWQQAVSGFMARPLAGFGWGTFEIVALRFQKETSGWSNYAHNFYFQILAEAGIFSLLSFLGFLGLAIRQIWRVVLKKRTDPFLVGGFGAILASSLHSFLDFDWHFPAVFLLVLLILAYLINYGRQNAEVDTEIFSGTKDSFLKNFVSPRILPRFLILISLLLFLFGQTEVLSVYFEQNKDYETALSISPWPPVRARRLADQIFTQDYNQGIIAGQRLVRLSPADPSINLWIARKYEEQAKLTEAADHYQKALELNPLGNYRIYPRLGRIYNRLGKTERQENLYNFFDQHLLLVKINKEDKTLAKTIYRIGYDFLLQGEEDKALYWWAKSPAWAPWWSYFYIEVASLYMKRGDKESAADILNECLKYYFPRPHCEEFITRMEKSKPFESPGFFRQEIEQMPDS